MADKKREGIKIKDWAIIKRMLAYAKPYWHLFLIALILILIITGTTLARPFITKIGIDTYITWAAEGTMSKLEASQGIYR